MNINVIDDCNLKMPLRTTAFDTHECRLLSDRPRPTRTGSESPLTLSFKMWWSTATYAESGYIVYEWRSQN